MKTARNVILVTGLALTFLLSACGATATPTAPPATPLPATELPTVAPSPTLASLALAGPQSGEKMTWVDGSTLIYIPPAEFVMGNGTFDAPEHNVTLAGYWIYQTKVTNRMFAQCVAVGACTPPAQELGGPVYSNPEYANHPVVGVTWDQAQTYCSWTQGQLPTEAQWEKSARGLKGNLYPWGNDEPACDLLNFAYCVGHTTEVNAYADGASPFGVLDMAGNVFEWVNDWYSETYYNEAPLTNPTGPDSTQYRVIRGSSFETDPDQVQVANRHYGATVYHSRDTGFRCVVTEPKPLAPYCQLSAYVPTTAAAAAGECQLPFTNVRGQYCAAGTGFATIDIPHGATYEVNTKDYKCTEAILNGERRLTCTGPNNSSGEITVCNPTCSNSPNVTGAEPVCDPGYKLDTASSACNYTPIGQAGVAGCPAGYVLVDRGGQTSCMIGRGANGQCPTGLYFDSLINACVPPNGQSEIPYGVDNSTLASQTYQGCAAGYTYSSTYQCCQAATSGTYPGCAPGSTFNADLGACSPGAIKLSGPGCVSVPIDILKCSEPVDVCSKITAEATCIRFAYACKWDDKDNVCKMK